MNEIDLDILLFSSIKGRILHDSTGLFSGILKLSLFRFIETTWCI
jgi:hypothetical protein